MVENSIEEDMKYIHKTLNDMKIKDEDVFMSAVATIFKDYKRVLKENEIYKKNSEIMSKENLSTAEQLKVEIKENFRLKNQLENNRKEYQETYKDVREELKELKKENEELLQEKIDNQRINLLAQNSMLDYQKGYEDGKANRGSAVQTIIDNQQYYIFQKQIEKYEEHIEKLQKENEELRQERELIGLPVKNKRSGKIGIILHQWKSGSVAVLENISQRVINTHDNWNTLEIINDNVEQQKIKDDYIPVQKVKDKIEELKEQYNVRELDFIKTTQDIRNIIIQSLEELLEGRK